ncbi:MAG: lipopolysaccharide assembly LapA domain-containing protein [Nitrospinota bacterium]
MIKTFKFVFGLIVLVILASFAAKNSEPVVLRYYYGYATPPVPLYVVLLAAVVVGAILAALFAIGERFYFLHELRKRNRTIREMEGELVSLRNLPLAEPLPASESGAPSQEGVAVESS